MLLLYEVYEILAENNLNSNLKNLRKLYNSELLLTSVANNQFTKIRKLILPKGTYLLEGHINFVANSTGQRSLAFFINDNYYWRDTLNAIGGGNSSSISSTQIVNIEADTEIYLVGYQNSNTSLSVESDLFAIVLS